MENIDNSFQKFVPDSGNSDVLWVSFAGRGYKPGKFMMYKTFMDIPGDKLHFNCTKNSWYLDDIERVNATIAQIQAQKNYRKVIYFGSSMGAYAAILFSILNKGSQTIAFSPIFYLLDRFSWSNNIKASEYADLTKLIAESPIAKPKLFVAGHDAFDMAFAERFPNYADYFETHFLDSNHDTLLALRQKHKLEDVMKSFALDEKTKLHPELYMSDNEVALMAKLYPLLAKIYDDDYSTDDLEVIKNLPEKLRNEFFIKLFDECKIYKDDARALKIAGLSLLYGQSTAAIKILVEKNCRAKNYSALLPHLPLYAELHGNNRTGMRYLFKTHVGLQKYPTATYYLSKLIYSGISGKIKPR